MMIDMYLILAYLNELKNYTNLDLPVDGLPDNMVDNLEMFEYFIATLGSEQYPLVLDIYNKLRPEVVKETLLEIHSKFSGILQLDDINQDLELYNINYECITKILIERGLINGQRIH